LVYFLAYAKQLVQTNDVHKRVKIVYENTTYDMQINEFLCIIHKFVNVVYGKTIYEYTIFFSENL